MHPSSSTSSSVRPQLKGTQEDRDTVKGYLKDDKCNRCTVNGRYICHHIIQATHATESRDALNKLAKDGNFIFVDNQRKTKPELLHKAKISFGMKLSFLKNHHLIDKRAQQVCTPINTAYPLELRAPSPPTTHNK